MFYSVGTRGESVLLQATDLRVKEAMGVGGQAWLVLHYFSIYTNLPLLFTPCPCFQPKWVHGCPSIPRCLRSLTKPQQHSPGEGGPGEAAADGGSTALPFPAVCWVTNCSYQPTSPSLGRQCCSSCSRARKSQPQLNCVFSNPPESKGLGQ